MASGILGKGTLKSADVESEGVQGSLWRRNWDKIQKRQWGKEGRNMQVGG